jgi:hypothetical protein
MAEDSMAVLDMLRKATADGNVDVLREGVRVLAEAIMEAEVGELTGAAKGRARPRSPADQPERLTRAALGYPNRHDRPGHPQGPRRVVLPVPPRAAAVGRAGPPVGRPGGLCRRRLDAPGRGPRGGPGHRLDESQRGQPDLRRARCRGRRLPDPLVGRRALSVSLPRCDARQGSRTHQWVRKSLLSAASAVDANRLRFVLDGAEADCHAGGAGTYTFTLSPGGGALSLTADQDQCIARSQVISGPWTRSDCPDQGRLCLGNLEAGSYASIGFTPFTTFDKWV